TTLFRSRERVEPQQPARKLVLHSNQHLVSPESANGCTERPTHERVEAARAFGVGSGLRSNRRQNALGCLWLTEYTNPVLILGERAEAPLYMNGNLRSDHWQVKRSQWLNRE